MPERKWLSRLVVAVLALALMGGLIRLARFSSAAYPPYSSLQSGRTGTKVLFEALLTIGKLEVSRNYLPLGEAQFQSSAVFYLGVKPAALASSDAALFAKLEGIAKSGNRLILGVTDERFESKRDKPPEIEKRWGIRITPQPGIVIEDASVWRALPDNGGFERAFGAGSIVLLPDSQRLNNESLAKRAAARTLVPVLVARHRKVVFEETHLGTVETGGVAGLARRYRLQGLFAGLLLVVILFIWNRSVAFPPPSRFERETDSVVSGSDARPLMVGLLSRHIAPGSLIDVCVSEWNRLRPDKKLSARDTKNPVATYLEIQNELQRKKIVKR